MDGARWWHFAVPLLILGQAGTVQAEKRILPGRYVVTLAQNEANASSNIPRSAAQANPIPSELQRAGVRLEAYLGGGAQAVVTRPIAAALTTDGVSSTSAPFDPSDTTCADLIASGGVQSCSPDYEVRIDAGTNDPEYAQLYGMTANQGIDATRAWDKTTGSSDVVVAVIDTGIDYNHPDLSANVWTNSSEIPGNGIDDDANGYIDDLHGINVVKNTGDPMDDNLHGTHVSGTIGALGNNGLGVVGVNWNVKVMALKFLNSDGSGSLSSAIKAIDYMVEMHNRGVNVRVSNNSWGGAGYSQPLADAIARARDAGIIFVAAAGNEGNDNDTNPSYPSSFELSNVVSVAAIDKDRNLANFSNRGQTTVDIAAPGVQIVSTAPGGAYKSLSGTSMAAPHVAGALALLLAAEPGLTNAAAIDRMYEAAIGYSSLTGVVRTGRALNAGRMLFNETSPVPNAAPPVTGCHYQIEEIGYNPDTIADNAPAILQADDGVYSNITLPFSFPFYRDQVSTVTVSPNGVVYMAGNPTGTDYQNLASAPRNSIAPLHTDMTTIESPYGVRAVALPDRTVITWYAKHYLLPLGGSTKVRLILYATGIIDEFVEFDSAETESTIQLHATVGISGSTAESTDTFATNSTKIKNGLALRYTNHCAAVPAAINVSSISIVQPGAASAAVKPGKAISVSFKGSGDGNVAVSAALNGLACPQVATVGLVAGSGTFSGKLPGSVRAFKTLTFRSGDASATAVVKKGKGKVQRAFLKSCKQLMSALK